MEEFSTLISKTTKWQTSVYMLFIHEGTELMFMGLGLTSLGLVLECARFT